jgi:hypothetical protein
VPLPGTEYRQYTLSESGTEAGRAHPIPLSQACFLHFADPKKQLLFTFKNEARSASF